MTVAERMPSALTIRLIGVLEVLLDGTPVPRLRARKGHWVLALLALRQGREVERSWLAGLLWPESAESEASASLRVSLTHLRAALGQEAGRLRSPTLHTLCLDLEGVEVDVAAFDAAIGRGDEAALAQAVALYRGPLLEGCTEEWAFQERQVREQAFLQALDTLAAAAMRRGDAAAAAGYLGRATAVDPLREGAQRGLMQALAAAGNYAAALLTYRELRLRLHRELNAEPDPETQALFQQLRAEARRKAAVSGQRSAVSKVKGGDQDAADQDLAGTEPRPLTPHPSGTVTFLLTDVEGSTRLWLQDPEAMRHALARHDVLAAAIIEQHDGLLVKQRGEGDSLFAVFARATDAVAAALAFQRALATDDHHPLRGYPTCGGDDLTDKVKHGTAVADSGHQLPLRVRVALHTGEAELREGDYFGLAVNHSARLRTVGHGAQTLLSQTTAALVRDELPAGASLRELGAHRLKDLQRPEPLFQLLHPDLPAAFPPLRSLEVFAHNLPVQLTSFIGRESEINGVKRLLLPRNEERGMRNENDALSGPHSSFLVPHPSRLLTLTGAGGCGKTRLALQVAADLVEEYRDGVWLVELAALAGPGLVPQAVAAALGVREEPNRPLTATLADSLRPRSLLLVLDNCEHLLGACAPLAEALLRACPNLQILASSREGLGIAGERTYRVPSLSVPGVQAFRGSGVQEGATADPERLDARTRERLLQYEAVRLFVERAVFARPRFVVTEQNAPALTQVCQRLDGIPLAIELAAAQVRVLSAEQIAARLDDRFRLLTGGSRTALPRHQTLRACIDWGYDLLTEPERVLLRRLSVFAGGWTLEAAEAVCPDEGCRVKGVGCRVDNDRLSLHPTPFTLHPDDVLERLTALVDKSLAVVDEQGPVVRYRLLETVRQYCRDRLLEAGETDSVRERHLEFFLQLAEETEPKLEGLEQTQWLDHLQREEDNVRAALGWCQTAGDAGAGLRLAGALVWFWVKRNYLEEGRAWLEEALSRGRAPASLIPISSRVKVLLGLGRISNFQDDMTASRSFLEESLTLARTAGDRRAIALSLCQLGLAAAHGKDYERLTTVVEECLALAREIGEPWHLARALHLSGLLAREQDDYPQALRLFDEGLTLARQTGDKWLVAMTLGNLAIALHQVGRADHSTALHIEQITLGQELKANVLIAWGLEGVASVAAGEGQVERAAHLLGAAEELFEALSAALPPMRRTIHDRTVDAARTALGEEAFAAAWAEGRAMSLDEAVCVALEHRPIASARG